jgi:hypothetical protein
MWLPECFHAERVDKSAFSRERCSTSVGCGGDKEQLAGLCPDGGYPRLDTIAEAPSSEPVIIVCEISCAI